MNKIIIGKPEIKTVGEYTYLTSVVEDGVLKSKKEYYFSVQKEYGKYLTYEVADAFVSALLMPAIITGQNIVVRAPLSEIFYYNLKNSVIHTICSTYNKSPIAIEPEALANYNFNPAAVATGFSGGVDSFTTFLKHTSDECPESLRLTHLTLMNVGSYGDTDAAHKNFKKDSTRSKAFANEVGIPLVLINSNIATAYNRDDCDVLRGFSRRLIISLISGILSLQKLFKYYLISSSRTIKEVQLSTTSQQYSELLFSSFLSTKNTKIMIAEASMDRLDKIKYIVDNPDVQKHLYVCLADIYNEKQNRIYNMNGFPNCSECDKCTRTILALEALNKEHLYKERFNLPKFYKVKSDTITWIYQIKNKHLWAKNLHDLLEENKYHVPISIKVRHNIRQNIVGPIRRLLNGTR